MHGGNGSLSVKQVVTDRRKKKKQVNLKLSRRLGVEVDALDIGRNLLTGHLQELAHNHFPRYPLRIWPRQPHYQNVLAADRSKRTISVDM